MLSRMLGLAALGALAWWAWNGPIRDWRTTSPEEQLRANAEQMALCLRGKEYVAGAGGAYTQDAEAACARELNLYRHEGRWYSYASTRPAAGQGRAHRS
jgi:hypothetical protein